MSSALAGHIFLYGPPGSGKSRVGRRLAALLEQEFIDLDDWIEVQIGSTIPEIMETKGEGYFRQIEKVNLQQATGSSARVIALGGGTLLDEENRAMAEASGRVICLSASYPTLLRRLGHASSVRPLLAGDLAEKLAGLLERRGEHYRSFPLQVDTERRTPRQVAWEIQTLLGLFHIQGMGDGYDVLFREGGLETAGEALQSRGLRGPVALVSDDNTGRLYSGRVAGSLRQCGYRVSEVSLPAGEKHKTLESVSRLWSAFLQAGLERSSSVVALGGGVIGDLSGFAAATFLRGVPWVAMPTTLLAMVDAHLGGKTGFDLPEGKNLAGAFHPPRLVLADPLTLGTLPEEELRNGLAEVIKHGIIGDERLFNLCEKGWEAIRADWSSLIRRAMAVKIDIIQQDPYEGSRRAALNYGHTVGHAVESVSGYRIRHGVAVAMGMVAEARLAETMGLAKEGLAERIEGALRGVGLPVSIPNEVDRKAILQAMAYDKKRRDGQIQFALPVRIGEVKTGLSIGENEISLLLEASKGS